MRAQVNKSLPLSFAAPKYQILACSRILCVIAVLTSVLKNIQDDRDIVFCKALPAVPQQVEQAASMLYAVVAILMTWPNSSLQAYLAK